MSHLAKYLFLMSLLSFLGCGQKEPASPLKYIHISGTHGYYAHSNIGYSAERMENGRTRIVVEVGNDRDRVFETDGSLMDTLEAYVREYRMYQYSGHYQPEMDILDGDSWSLDMQFADGESASCSGYMAYPPRKGSEAIGKVEGCLSRWLYQEPAEEIGLISYRYELHDKEGAACYSLQKNDSTYTIFCQKQGARQGDSYQTSDATLARRMADLIRWTHMASYSGEKVSEVDASRPYWMLVAHYENGQTIKTMDYLDRSVDDSWRHDVPSMSEMTLRYDTEHYFETCIQSIIQPNDPE